MVIIVVGDNAIVDVVTVVEGLILSGAVAAVVILPQSATSIPRNNTVPKITRILFFILLLSLQSQEVINS
jgi:hypothetical protein